MRNTKRKLLTLALLAAAGRSAAPPASDEAEFKGLIQRYWQAWSSLNPDNAAPLYAKDADVVFFDVSPLKYTGWEEYKAGVTKFFATAASANFAANDDLKVTRHGDIAWTTSTIHGTINQKSGETMQFTGRHTAIWEKRGGKWIIVHEHVSAPLP